MGAVIFGRRKTIFHYFVGVFLVITGFRLLSQAFWSSGRYPSRYDATKATSDYCIVTNMRRHRDEPTVFSSNYMYAQSQGAEFIVSRSRIAEKRGLYREFNKLFDIQQSLLDGCNVVLWMDSDVLVLGNCV